MRYATGGAKRSSFSIPRTPKLSAVSAIITTVLFCFVSALNMNIGGITPAMKLKTAARILRLSPLQKGRLPQDAFSLFLSDGRVAIDNNPAERALRPIGIDLLTCPPRNPSP